MRPWFTLHVLAALKFPGVFGIRSVRALHATTPLSLSRLNHRSPRVQTHPASVPGATACQHQSAAPWLPPTQAGLHHAAALATARDLLHAQAPRVQRRG